MHYNFTCCVKLPLLSAYGTSCALLTLLDLLLEKASCAGNNTLKNMALVRCFVLTSSHTSLTEREVDKPSAYLHSNSMAGLRHFGFLQNQLLLMEQGRAKWGGLEPCAQLLCGPRSLDLLPLPPKWPDLLPEESDRVLVPCAYT